MRRTWCEIEVAALRDNLKALRSITSPSSRLVPVVKGNAYGHGLVLCAEVFMASGADGLGVDSLHEAMALRAAGLDGFLYILGYVPGDQAEALVSARCSVVVYGEEEVRAFSAAATRAGVRVPVHVKLETGNHRQGLYPSDAHRLIELIGDLDGVWLEGISSHFANVEDTTDHGFARAQLASFRAFLASLPGSGRGIPLVNIANSAATILWPEAHGGLVRAGIASYGMWPSKETLLSTMLEGREPLELRPAMCWRTKVAQVRSLPAGVFVGYGATFQTTHPIRLAILPVGYYDGYDRGLSNLAHVLIRGHRAPLRGRVCMNMIMVDVTDIPGVAVGDVVTLLGEDGGARISAEDVAGWIGTINYEVTTRINERIPRIAR